MTDDRVPFVIAGSVDAIDRVDQHVRIGPAGVWLGPATTLDGVDEGTHVCIAGHQEGGRWIAEEILRPRSRR